MSTSLLWNLSMVELPGVIEDGMPGWKVQRKPGTARGSPRRSRTAKASRISRSAVKSRCACERGGWGRLSDDGLGQHNPIRSEDPCGGGHPTLHGGALSSPWPRSVRDNRGWPRGARRAKANGRRSAHAGSGLRLTDAPGRPRLISQPSSHQDITRRDAMKGGIGAVSLAAMGAGAALPAAIATTSVAVTADTAQAQRASRSENLTQPATGIVMHPGYARTIAQMAYVWGWPLVNMINRNAAITQAPQPGHLNGVLPAAPRGQLAMLADYIEPSQTFVACPNQDVVYGLGFFSLDEEPVVIQVPDFGDRFWVYALYDQRTDQFGALGKQYQSQPGFYLLVGPNWTGEARAGIAAVMQSSTALANAIPRVFMDDTAVDRAA